MSDEKKEPAPELFPYDEMSTGVASSLQRRAEQIVGKPKDIPTPDPSLKPMTGAQLAFKPKTGSHAAFKPNPPAASAPTTGTQPAFKPTTGTHAAFKPKPSTGTHAAFKPSQQPPPVREEDEAPVFDAERLQAQFRAMSITDSALGRGATTAKPVRPPKLPASAAEDTFVKSKMKEAESKVPDFNLDEDLG
ncbi:MAG: hypothetical protein ACO1OB_28385 [Archangium sp.]